MKPTNKPKPASAKSANAIDSSKRGGKPLAENCTIPLVSVLDDTPTLRRATKLLKEAHEQKKIRDVAEIRVKACKEELAAIALVDDLPGLRYGNIAIQVNGYISRKTFNKDKAKSLMLEYGVPPEKIGGCYESGEEYLDTKLIELL